MSHDALLTYRRQVLELVREKKNFRIPNRQRQHAEILIEQIFKSAESTVRLFCGGLDEKFYSRPSIESAIFGFLAKPGASLYILTEKALSDTHSIVSNLLKSQDGRVQIRYLTVPTVHADNHFAVFDETGFRFEFSHSPNGDVEAVANFNEPVTAGALIQIFDDMFVSASPARVVACDDAVYGGHHVTETQS